MNKFKIGDPVQLFTGGKKMTAGDYETDGVHLRCDWHDKAESKHEVYHEDQLRIYTLPEFGGIRVKRKSIWD